MNNTLRQLISKKRDRETNKTNMVTGRQTNWTNIGHTDTGQWTTHPYALTASLSLQNESKQRNLSTVQLIRVTSSDPWSVYNGQKLTSATIVSDSTEQSFLTNISSLKSKGSNCLT